MFAELPDESSGDRAGAPLDLIRSLGNGTQHSRLGIESPVRSGLAPGFHSTTLSAGVSLAHDD